MVAGGRIYLRVSDNGIGMTRELINSAFDLFVQGDRSLDRSEGGLGIGLSLGPMGEPAPPRRGSVIRRLERPIGAP